MITKEQIDNGKQLVKELKSLLNQELMSKQIKLNRYGTKQIVDLVKINYSKKNKTQITSIIIQDEQYKYKIDKQQFRTDIYFTYKEITTNYYSHYNHHYFWPVQLNKEYKILDLWENNLAHRL